MLIFLYGADVFRAKEKLEEIKKRFLEKNGRKDYLISTISDDDIDLAEFRNKVLSAGFFVEKKMIVLRIQKLEIRNQNNELLEIIKKIPEETVLVIWCAEDEFLKSDLGKFLLKQKFVYKFSPLSGNELVKWIRERAGQYGAEIDNDAIAEVIDILGSPTSQKLRGASDLWKIDLELQKLCAYVSDSRPHDDRPAITKKVVTELLAREAEENIFQFIDALAGKNKKLALLLLQNEFEAGATELGILGMVARHIRILLQIKVGTGRDLSLQKEKLAKELGIHPYAAQKALAQVKNFQLNELKNIYRRLLEIDMAVKTGGVPARVLFDRMIAKI